MNVCEVEADFGRELAHLVVKMPLDELFFGSLDAECIPNTRSAQTPS